MSRPRRGHLGIAAVALAIALLAPAGASAAPSKFVQELCDPTLPGGASPSAQFVGNPSGPLTPFDTCAQPNGGIGIAETGPASATYAYWSVRIPATPGGYVESVAISARACGLGPANNNAFVYEQGWPSNCAGESQRTFQVHSAPGTGPFAALASDAGFAIMLNCDGRVGPCSAGPTISARHIAATQVDVRPPALESLSGSLLGGGVLRGDHELRVEAADEGGGISQVAVTVNGLPAGSPVVPNCGLAAVKTASYQGTAAISPTPCPASAAGTWTLDTAAYPFRDGANLLEVCASDYSTLTEANRTCQERTLAVDNSCTESAVGGGEVLSVRFARSRGATVRVPFRKAAKVTGELASNAGDPIAGATVCVQAETQGATGGPRPVGVAVTDARGRFVYRVPPGPNRRFLVGYRHDTFQVARSLRYFARVRPAIRISPGRVRRGGVIRIRGRLPGPEAGGRVLVLQASALRSKRWYTFLRTTTNRRGVYRARYRFDATTRTIVYRIRALAPRQRGYAWEAGHSRPALVKVKAGSR